MGNAYLDAVGFCEASHGGAFGGGQGGWDGDVVEELACLLVLSEGDGFGAVDG